MKTLEEIKTAIVELPESERRSLMDWLDELAEAEWDRQIEEDSKSGRLDRMLREADEDIQAGRYTDA